MKPKPNPLAREVEQLEPEHVQWMLEQGYVRKDKQATRITEAGEKWLLEVEQRSNAMLGALLVRRH